MALRPERLWQTSLPAVSAEQCRSPFRRSSITATTLALLVLLPVRVGAQAVELASGTVAIESLTVVDLGDQGWIDAAATSTGDLIVADMFTGTLVRLTAHGERLWTAGGSG